MFNKLLPHIGRAVALERHSGASGKPSRTHHSLRLALVSLVSALAVAVAFAAPANANDLYGIEHFEDDHRINTPGPDVLLELHIDEGLNNSNYCQLLTTQKFEIVGASSHQQEAAIESGILQSMNYLPGLDLSGGVWGWFSPTINTLETSYFPSAYLNVQWPSGGNGCPDVVQNNAHRNLQEMSQGEKTVMAVVAGGAVTTGVIIAINIALAYVAPLWVGNSSVQAGIACLAGALGVYTTQSILGGVSPVTKAASAISACVFGAGTTKVQAAWAWFAAHRGLAQAVRPAMATAGGAELITTNQTIQMTSIMNGAF